MSEYLPQEVLIEIFLKLPTKSIIQFTSVCKSWYSLITSPNFISTHLNYQDEYLLVRHCSGEPVKEIYALFCDNENFDQYAQFDFPFECYSHFNIVGSCNGLLCLSDDLWGYRDRSYIWNPSIRKSVKLPEPIFTYRTYGPFDHTLGFGFDSVTNDYKVVRIVHSELYTDWVPPHAELYKLSTGVWQDITPVSPSCMYVPKIPGFYMNGTCHWIASKQKGGESQNMIVLFDVHEETFWEMMVPDSLVWNFSGFFCNEFVLFASDESLCLADSSSGNDKTIDIWMMKEYGDPESWVKQFSISSRDVSFNVGVVDEFFSMLHGGRQRQVAHFLVKPIASRKHGEILWRADNGLLVSYDPVAENIKNLGIHNANYLPYRDALYVNTYKVSLILLGKQTDYSAGDTCEGLSCLCKKETKGGRKFHEGNTKRGFRLTLGTSFD
ncbi:PREDICTED: F-box protein At3g07870-like isoform X2 [Nicotiana attenuata]|uniref:F-box protein At3g07870-like isoform X2 n=1 Tax=Nicotiana attenuata TaxID=49451 RepID=UPI0009046087|nr:PREDICTED: F-box protein At3g07870-like isoform X2 [Nicotiana attenuata]